MNPKDLTVEQVKTELESLVRKYPDRQGSLPIELDGSDFACVYYTDENGVPINHSEEEVVLATPVCIIGTWIEEFHPEFKMNPVIGRMLRQNSTVYSTHYYTENPFPSEVTDILDAVQVRQDKYGITWKDIDLS